MDSLATNVAVVVDIVATVETNAGVVSSVVVIVLEHVVAGSDRRSRLRYRSMFGQKVSESQ